MKGKKKNAKSEEVFLRLRAPRGCHLWKKKRLEMTDLKFEVVERYVDESHFMRMLFKCPQCGQLYYSEFLEDVDWIGGNDRQYSTYIPVDGEKGLIERLNNTPSFGLLAVTPRIQWDNFLPPVWVGKRSPSSR